MMKFVLPKICCVMATNGRIDCIKKSVYCYLNQTYSNKSLLILSQGTESVNQEIQCYLKSLSREDIQFFTAPQNLSLGGLRNTLVEMSQGDIICQWDDDDLYHPLRLITQYNCLRSNSGNVASLYCDFLKYFENSQELYWCDWSSNPVPSNRYLCGTVMFHKEVFAKFPIFYPDHGSQCHVEEDLNALQKLVSIGSIGPVFAGYQYVYVYHGKNTYDIDHHYLGIDTKWSKKLHSVDELLNQRKLLEETFIGMGIRSKINVRSADAIAFTYEGK